MNNSNYFKKFFKIFTGNSSSEIVHFLCAPIISRLYSPIDFSFFILITTIAELILPIANLKLEILITKNYKQSNVFFVASIVTCFFITTILLVLSYVVFILMGIDHYEILFFSYCLVNTTNFFRSFELKFMASENYDDVVKVKIISKAFIQFFQLLLQVLNQYGLIIGRISGQILGLIKYRNYDKSKFKFKIKHVNTIIRLFTRNQKSQIKILVSSSIRVLQNNVVKLMIPILFKSKFLGLYGWAFKYTIGPLSIITMALSDTLFEHMSKKFEKGIIYKTLLFQIFLGLPIFTLTFFYGEILFSFFFGNNWTDSGYITEIISPYLFLIFITSPNTFIFYLTNREKELLYFDSWNLTSTSFSFLLAWLLNLSFFETLYIFSAIGTINYFSFFLRILYIINCNEHE